MRRRLPCALLAAAALAGCGSAATDELPPAQTAPEPTAPGQRAATPAGRVVRVAPDDAGLGAAVGVGDRLAVVRARPAQLLLLDAGGRVRHAVALGAPATSAPVADRGDVLVGAGGRLLRIDPRTGTVLARQDRRATSIARVATGLATLDPAAGAVTVAPESGGGAPVRIPVGPGATQVVRVGEGDELAVLDGRARTVELRDVRTGRRLGSAPVGVAPAQIASRGRWLWVTDARGGALLVLSVARRELELVRRVYVPGGPFALVVQAASATADQDHRRLQVVQARRARIAELTANGRPNALERRVALPDPVGIAFVPDARTLAVTSGGRVQLVGLPPVDPDQADHVPEG